MANLPISGLPAGSTVAGTEPFPSVQSPGGTATTVKILASDIKTYTNNAPTFTGQSTFAAGTALLPSITTTGDTNTGVWFPAADTVAASTGGTERVRITSTGVVGIGNTSPSAVFGTTLVVGPSGGTGTISVPAGYVYSNTTNDLKIAAGTAASGAIIFQSAFTAGEYMRISGSGNVGIGTTSPATQFHVVGASTLVGQVLVNNAIATSNGRIVIDTASLSGIDIYRSDTTANYSAIRFRDTTNANTYGSVGFDSAGLRLDGVAGTMYLSTSGNERMRITSAGNVGIGTTSPTQKLQVNGNSLITPEGGWTTGQSVNLYFGDTAGSVAYDYDTTNMTFTSYGLISFKTNFNALEKMRITAAGNVGIGTTSPGNLLEVASATSPTIRITRSSSHNVTLNAVAGGAFSIGLDGSGGGTERLRIDSSGNVGIGTTTPLNAYTRLHVSRVGYAQTVYENTSASIQGEVSIYDASSPMKIGTLTQHDLQLSTAGSRRMSITAVGNVYAATGSTGMTDGFFYMPSAAGAPSGTPTAISGTVPFYYDTTNNQFYVYNGAWKKVALA